MRDMDMAKLVKYARENCQMKVPPVEGKPFPEKPKGFNTVGIWFGLGYKPKNIVGDGQIFLLKGGPEGYTYFGPEDVVPLTDGERRQLDELGIKHDDLPRKEQVFGGSKRQYTNEYYHIHQGYPHSGAEMNSYQQKKQSVNLTKKYSGARNLENLPPIPNMKGLANKKVVCLKIEATSRDYRNAEAVRLILVGMDEENRGKVLIQKNLRIKGNIGSIPDRELDKAHITRREIEYGCTPEELKGDVMKCLKDADVVVVYDSRFHLNIFEKSFGISVPREKVIDLQDVYRAHNNDQNMARMGTAIHRYCDNELAKIYDQWHTVGNSLVDARCLMSLYQNMYKSIRIEQEQMRERNGGSEVHQDDKDDRER